MKIKKLNEDIMANSERQVAGVGPGSTDQPFYQMAIPTPDDSHIKAGNTRAPFELDYIKDKVFDIFEKLVDLRNDFERAETNVSVSEAQKIALKKSINRLDIINKKLIELPDFLVLFNVDI